MKCQACGATNYRPADGATRNGKSLFHGLFGWIRGYKIVSSTWTCPHCKRVHYSDGTLVEEKGQKYA